MFCKKCGNEVPKEAKYCTKCGTPVNNHKPEEVKDDNNREINIEGTNEANLFEEPNKKKKVKKKKKKNTFGRILLFLIFVSVVWCVLASKFHIGLWIPIGEEETDYQAEESGIEVGTLYSLDVEDIQHDDSTGIDYVDNIILVYFEKDATQENIDNVVDYVEGEIVGEIPVLNNYQIQVSGRSYTELKQLCKEVEMLAGVKAATIDTAMQLSENMIPNDPWETTMFIFGDEWSEDNPEGSNWHMEAINAPSAWEYNDYLSPSKIGVIDTGFLTSHTDLKGVIKSTTGNSNQLALHGTHVAGIIGAIPNNKKGITGLVWDCELHTTDWKLTFWQEGKEEYADWNTTMQILTGVTDLVVEHGVKVINISAGQTAFMTEMTRPQDVVDEEGYNASIVIGTLLEQGYDLLVVQSAGNGNKNGYAVDAVYNGMFCSVNEDNCEKFDTVSANDIMNRIIVVGAARNDGNHQYTLAEFSNAGSRVDICAPGEGVYSLVPGLPGDCAYLGGTSQAAPIVTGVASMVWAADSSLTGAEVKAIVCNQENTKYEVKDNTSEKHPLVNSYRMVNAELAVKVAVEGKIARAQEEDGALDENPIATKTEREAEAKEFSGAVMAPEDVVMKMYGALRQGDYEMAAQCLDPATEQELDFWGGIATTFLGMLTGEYVTWGELMFEAEGAKDVEIIECHAYNLEYGANMDIFSGILSQIPEIGKHICTEADVYVKYRYQYNGEYYIEEGTFHVRRYEWSGWRVEVDWL